MPNIKIKGNPNKTRDYIKANVTPSHPGGQGFWGEALTDIPNPTGGVMNYSKFKDYVNSPAMLSNPQYNSKEKRDAYGQQVFKDAQDRFYKKADSDPSTLAFPNSAIDALNKPVNDRIMKQGEMIQSTKAYTPEIGAQRLRNIKDSQPSSYVKPFSMGTKSVKKAASGLQDVAVPQQGSFSNVLSDGTSLAASGASVGGPWGAAIGGALGIGVGLLQKNKQDKANKKALLTNQINKGNRLYASDDTDVNQSAQVFGKGGKVNTKVIEIEGKKTPEIHTDKNFKVKNLGTTPHSMGGNKVHAEEGDIVFNTQNSLAKYNKIASAIQAGDKTTLHKEKNKLPEDGNKAQQGLRVKPKPKSSLDSVNTMSTDDIQRMPRARFKGLMSRANREAENNYYNEKKADKENAMTKSANERWGSNKSSSYSPGQNYIKTPDFTLGAGGKGINNTQPINPVINKAITADKEFTSKSSGNSKISSRGVSKTNSTPQSIPSLNGITPKVSSVLDKSNNVDLPSKLPLLDTPNINTSKEDTDTTTNSTANSKINNALAFTGVANNLFQGLKNEPGLNESYYNPSKIKYNDRSQNLRNQSTQAMNVNNANARNLSGGNVANLRANQAASQSDNMNRQEGINEGEQGRADAINAQNTEISNQAANVNLQRKDNYQQIMMGNKSAKESFIGQAASDIGQYGLAKQEEGYLRSRDDKANAAQMAGYNSINGRYQHKSNLDGSTYFQPDADSSITKYGTSGGNRSITRRKPSGVFSKGTKSITTKYKMK